MDNYGSFGSLPGSDNGLSGVSTGPLSQQTAEYNKKRAYGAASGGWLAFIGMLVLILLLILFGNAGA